MDSVLGCNMENVLKSWNQQIYVLLFCCTLSDRIFLRSPAVMMTNPLSAADTPPKRVYTSLKTPTNFDVKVIQGSSKVRCLLEQHWGVVTQIFAILMDLKQLSRRRVFSEYDSASHRDSCKYRAFHRFSRGLVWVIFHTEQSRYSLICTVSALTNTGEETKQWKKYWNRGYLFTPLWVEPEAPAYACGV